MPIYTSCKGCDQLVYIRVRRGQSLYQAVAGKRWLCQSCAGMTGKRERRGVLAGQLDVPEVAPPSLRVHDAPLQPEALRLSAEGGPPLRGDIPRDAARRDPPREVRGLPTQVTTAERPRDARTGAGSPLRVQFSLSLVSAPTFDDDGG